MNNSYGNWRYSPDDIFIISNPPRVKDSPLEEWVSCYAPRYILEKIDIPTPDVPNVENILLQIRITNKNSVKLMYISHEDFIDLFVNNINNLKCTPTSELFDNYKFVWKKTSLKKSIDELYTGFFSFNSLARTSVFKWKLSSLNSQSSRKEIIDGLTGGIYDDYHRHPDEDMDG